MGQFLRPCREFIIQTMNQQPPVDMCLQKEFDDIGVNIGVVSIRKTPAMVHFWQAVYDEITEKEGFDQRVVNNLLYSDHASREWGVTWRRFPNEIWASSMAFQGPPPENMMLHHANFTSGKVQSSDPSHKLSQMVEFQAFTVGENAEKLAEFVVAVQEHPVMTSYREKHFGVKRPGLEWAYLPEGHP